MNVGPVDQVPVAMSSRIVIVLFVGADGVNPPTTYRYCPTVWYPARKNACGAGFPVVQLLEATS